MATIENMKRDRNKITHQYDIYNPEFTNFTKEDDTKVTIFNSLIDRFEYLAGYFRWYP